MVSKDETKYALVVVNERTARQGVPDHLFTSELAAKRAAERIKGPVRMFRVKTTVEVVEIALKPGDCPLFCNICDVGVKRKNRLAHLRTGHGDPKSRWPRDTIDRMFRE